MDMKALKQSMFKSKRAQAAGDKIVDSVIAVVIIATIWGGTVGLILNTFTNLSGSGLVLGVLFATVLPLLLAVGVFKSVRKGLGF